MQNITFKIFRFDPKINEAPYFDNFDIPVRHGDTALAGLFYIQKNIDPSLAFRFSCRGAVCGSCAMHINGKYRLACETQILELNNDTITIQPLGHLQILRDLIVDFTPFYDNYSRIKPYLIGKGPVPEKEYIQLPEERNRIGNTIDCILCGACYASCLTAGTNKEYFGPAALLKVERFLLDSRDNIADERLRIVDDLHGVWRCHSIFSCQEVCPKGLSPAEAISEIKKRLFYYRSH
ncbi:MAG: succinate dehydrogenase iron-sulfur subunit [Nitrospirae bacterium]|nr:succinate dehydrogenase iron-sulfur subunit [Nitrospirota bacterium]